MASNVPLRKSMSSNVQEIQMSGDEKWVRNRVSQFQEWRRSRSLVKNVSKATVEETTNTPVRNVRAEDIGHEQYAKGFQDGWKAALLTSKDSTAPSSCTSVPATAHCTAKSQSLQLTSQQVEKRGFKAGWDKAWEVIKRNGWTKGCVHCSAHLRYQKVVQQTDGVVMEGEFLDVRPSAAVTGRQR